MSVLLTKSCQYAIQAVLFLATKQKNKPVLQRDIAESLDIPVHFLGKILQQLVKQNIVSSQKGKLGGFFLSYPFAKVTLYKIAQIIDGENFLDGCMVGFPFCSDKSPCPLHEDWKKIKEDIIATMNTKHTEQLSIELQKKLVHHQLNNTLEGEKND